MDVFLWIAVIALAIIVAALSVKLHLMKKSAAEILQTLSGHLSEDSNTLIDISSRDRHMRRLAGELNLQLRLLREERLRFTRGDAELKEAVTNISHDLRTPLTAICGYLDLLESEEKSEAVTRYLAMIANRTEALKQLTQELFRYSVIVSVNDESRETLDISSVLEESLASYYGAMTQRKIVPIITITETKVERYSSRSALSRIFSNIISNALKYSDGDFEVSLDENGAIVFSNSAADLTSVEVGKLFDRFYTVESGRNSTGLGLSIAKLLTERLDGEISADYSDGRLYIRLNFPASEDTE